MKSPTLKSLPQFEWKTNVAYLTAIPALIILCLAAAPGPQSSSEHLGNKAPQLEGAWLVSVDFPDGSTFESTVSYAAGGAMIGSDPSVFPHYPMTTPFHGTWAKKGHRQFVFTAVSFQYDNVADDYPDGLYKYVIKETVTIGPSGNDYNGEGTVACYDPSGNLVMTFPEATRAVRIQAE